MNKVVSAIAIAAFCIAAYAVQFHWHYLTELIDGGRYRVTTQTLIVDKGWRPKVRPGRTWEGTFVPYDEYHDQWIIVTTSRVERPMSVPARSVYRDTVTNLQHQVEALSNELEHAGHSAGDLEQQFQNGLYAIEKTKRYYIEREETAPDEKLKTIYHDMQNYLDVIRNEFETPPNR